MEVNLPAVGKPTVGVIVIRAEILVVPLNGETEDTIYLAAGHLHVLADVTVSDVAGVCPAEAISPLEHGFAIFIRRRNQRDHIGRMPILQQSLHRGSRREYVFDEILNRDLLYPRELLRVNSDVPLHLAENISPGPDALRRIAVGKQDVVHRNIVQSSEAPSQGRQISKVGDRLLRILKHFLCVNCLGPLVVCRGHDDLVFANSLIQFHPLADIDQESTHAVVADSTDGHTGVHGLFPGKVVPEFLRRCSIHSLVLLEFLQDVLPFLALIQGFLAD